MLNYKKKEFYSLPYQRQILQIEKDAKRLLCDFRKRNEIIEDKIAKTYANCKALIIEATGVELDLSLLTWYKGGPRHKEFEEKSKELRNKIPYSKNIKNLVEELEEILNLIEGGGY